MSFDGLGNITHGYENLRKFINFMNMSEEELYVLIKHHFPNNSIRNLFHTERSVVCMDDPDKYCDGTLKSLAVAYKNIHGYVSLAVCLFGTIANLLNAAVLTRKEMSSAPINRILTGLAVADMLVMLEYVPFSCYMYLIFPDTRNFPYSWALFILFHVHFSQVLHTISICLTLTLAIWRYISIRHPQRSVLWCTEHRCHIAIATSYILPLFLCIPSYLVFHIRTTTIKENATDIVLYHLDLSDIAKENDRFLCNITFWTYGVLIKLLPCAILTVISCRLIQALYKVKKRKQALKGYSSCNANEQSTEKRVSKAEKKTDRTTKMLVAILLLFLITEFPQGILGLLSGILGTCFFRNCYNFFGEVMDILALINGAINFILYCFMSRQFRLTFEKLFKPKALVKWVPRMSQTDLQSTYV
ncbi:hypothetical protein RUM44_011385 [Polyplax serrata]|uniref:G-protein coupled receptors family 1 profile domain-containing protein n=1 Tax=Polyplax serrata TaxID=468196 RepID=A0ABR1APZ1_POLSC